MSRRRDPRKTAVGLLAARGGTDESMLYGVLEDDDRYYVRFLDEGGDRELCLLELMSRPHLALLAARFLHATSLGNSHSTRLKKKAKFLFIYPYLEALENRYGVDVQSIGDIDQQIVDGYESWLDGDDKYKSTLVISDATKKTRYNFLREVIEWARLSKVYSHDVSDISYRSHAWARSYRRSQSAESLNTSQITRLRKACRADIQRTRNMLRLGQRMLQTPLPANLNIKGRSVVPFKALAVKIALFSQVVSGPNPSIEQFRAEFPGLSRSLRQPYGTIDEVAEYLYLTCQTILPFIIMLEMETGYNPSTQCGILQSDVTDDPIWPNSIRIAPKKYRANGKIQARTFKKDSKNEFSVPSLLQMIGELTSRYRKFASEQDQRFILLVWTRLGERPTPLIDRDRKITGIIYRELKAFAERHHLDAFTLSALRQTVADFIHIVSDGDANAIKTILGHATLKTSEQHYNSKGQKWRRASQLATAVRVRQRFIDSNGKIELGASEEGAPFKAATPGFLCWDIFDSPVPGQKKGRPCSAYGCCPNCPLACALLGDPLGLCRLVQLKKLYEKTRSQVDHIRWAVQWNCQYEALQEIWLPAFETANISTIRAINLPPLPELE